MKRRVAVFLVMSAVVLAACGDDESTVTTTAPSESSDAAGQSEAAGGFTELGGKAEDLGICLEDGGVPRTEPFNPGRGTPPALGLDQLDGLLIEGLEGERMAVITFPNEDLAQAYLNLFNDQKNIRLFLAEDRRTIVQMEGTSQPADSTLDLLEACLREAGGDSTAASFPPVEENEAGLPYAPVTDEAEAEALCDAAQATWPADYAAYDQVTFDIPGTGSDVTCVRVD
jgi:hypothetical protein